MKRGALFLLGTLFLGAGCASQPTGMMDPCAHLPRAVVVQGTTLDVTIVEPETFPSGLSRCSYYTGERELMLQVAQHTQTISEYVAQTRNMFPTNLQPSIQEQVVSGMPSALVTIDGGILMLYVTSGTQGYLLMNPAHPGINRDMLITFAQKLVW